MRRIWLGPARVAAGLLIAALCASPQGTISAKPGAVNYIEGNAFLNGTQISEKATRSTFLNANDTLSTDLGKAEVLLTPGVFLRLGDNTQVRMVSPSLTDTQVEVLKGEAMLEAAGLLKGNGMRILSHGATITVLKNGLYRVWADNPPMAAVIDGKATVALEGRQVDLKKGKQTILSAELKPEKFDAKKADELYAWSNVRSAYEAAASYQSARTVNAAGGNLASLGYTGGAFDGPGWMWNSAFNSWAWLPHNGAFYSPFGYGFYAPGMVSYAPYIVAPVYGGGRMVGGHWNHPSGTAQNVPVPVSPNNPAAVGTVAQSPWQYRHAQSAAARSLAESGGQNGAAAPVGGFEGHHGNWSGANGTPGANNSGHPGWSGQGHPGWSGQGHPGWSGQGHPGWSGQGHPGGAGGGWSGGGHPGAAGGGGGHPGGGPASGGGHPGGGGGGAPRSR